MNLYDVYPLFDIHPEKAKGCFVFDETGKEYLDFYGGHAVISIGHSHPHYVERIVSQLGKIGFYSNSIINPLQQQLAQKLEDVSGHSNYDLFLVNSGAEAIENALKLASFYNERRHILALTNSFHGRTSAAINISHSGAKHQAPINQGIEVTYCQMDKVEELQRELASGKYAAIIIEAIQGIGGLDEISDDALRAIRKSCDDSDTLLIMDEIQCGYGRSGKFFGFDRSGIRPDLVTLAKGMGNGFPIGGVLINPQKMPAVTGRLGTTFGGNHLACAAGLAVLEVMDHENLIANAHQKGNELSHFLGSLAGVKQVKGRGLMLGVEFDFPVSNLRNKLVFEHNLFTGSSANPNLLRILPPLTIHEKEVDLFMEKFTSGLKTYLSSLHISAS
jgi:acetylornithine aminotransferase